MVLREATAAIGLLITQVVDPLVDRGAFPAELAPDKTETSASPSKLRLWWWWHQLFMCCVVAPLIAFLTWLGWHEASVAWGRPVFIAEVVALGLGIGARVTLLFFAFFEVPDFAVHLRRLGVWQRISMLIVAAGLLALAAALSDPHVGLAATLASLAILGLIGSEIVEPAIARGAFPETRNHNHRDL